MTQCSKKGLMFTVLIALLIGGIAGYLLAFGPWKPQTASHSTSQIETIVHRYLVKHPEVLVEASNALQKQQMQQARIHAKAIIKDKKTALFDDPASPVLGNPNGTITLVEFLDYQCGHCKQMANVVDALIKANPELKVVIKQLPIIGNTSILAAKLALAVWQQNPHAFNQFHQALFKLQGALNETRILNLAGSLNLNTQQLKADVNKPMYETQIKKNYQLARTLNLVGTPAFVLTNKAGTSSAFVPGAASQTELQSLINKAK